MKKNVYMVIGIIMDLTIAALVSVFPAIFGTYKIIEMSGDLWANLLCQTIGIIMFMILFSMDEFPFWITNWIMKDFDEEQA